MTRLDRDMRIQVKYNEEVLIFESEGPKKITEILKNFEIPSSTVLAVYEDTIVPHSSIISEDIIIELIVVSSGG
jgi:sulfur carrier protein ThiS|tara:strand:- start:15162 stop:15383 length:222 start_codon:yes stop_codon:yes gene_type:complete